MNQYAPIANLYAISVLNDDNVNLITQAKEVIEEIIACCCHGELHPGAFRELYELIQINKDTDTQYIAYGHGFVLREDVSVLSGLADTKWFRFDTLRSEIEIVALTDSESIEDVPNTMSVPYTREHQYLIF